ncbi:uncharacterized protein MELLADRAFT_85844 [Melampsora larici-populina 98AG31]|uniref:Uncharacterized protein n=1 Tax=Melampsora larici-populina (strain 98AG31 / pathotype 3-4-7) TaxID=747676 RepID=F4RJZ7_MELLP|nr:uncharacterized protein MELLADRAFT_85844 [Melampsora larici-populina 98AG31]EGG07401.1 hypothetical protein MELLADRAFT_85844 [Melampsora larici-populina 98AG31]
MDPSPECIVELEAAFFSCLACPNSRLMQSNSVAKHIKTSSHQKHLSQWISERKATAAAAAGPPPRSNSGPLQPEIEIEEGFNQEDPEIPDIASDQASSEPEHRDNSALIDLWAQDHSNLFRSPVHRVNSIEDESIGEGSIESDSDDEDNESEGNETHSQASEDGDDSSWAPFSSLEVFISSSYQLDVSIYSH